MYAYLWLSHVFQQKLSQHWEAIIFQKKKKEIPAIWGRWAWGIVIQDDVLWYNINTKRLFMNKGPWCRVGVITSDRSRWWTAVRAWDLCPLRFGWRGRGRGDKAVWGGPATREGRKLAAVGYGVFSAVARNLEFFLQVKGDSHGSLHRQAA